MRNSLRLPSATRLPSSISITLHPSAVPAASIIPGFSNLKKLAFQRHFGSVPSVSEVKWFVAHTRPRCEKKVVEYCAREGVETVLPCFRSAHKYRGKTAVFFKPLFPGYVFLRMPQERRQKVYQSDYVANLLDVYDQAEFEAQLQAILAALDTELEIRLAPEIGEGTKVRIKTGPLRGMEAWVEKRYGMSTALLRLDFISQAAAIQLEADALEPI